MPNTRIVREYFRDSNKTAFYRYAKLAILGKGTRLGKNGFFYYVRGKSGALWRVRNSAIGGISVLTSRKPFGPIKNMIGNMFRNYYKVLPIPFLKYTRYDLCLRSTYLGSEFDGTQVLTAILLIKTDEQYVWETANLLDWDDVTYREFVI